MYDRCGGVMHCRLVMACRCCKTSMEELRRRRVRREDRTGGSMFKEGGERSGDVKAFNRCLFASSVCCSSRFDKSMTESMLADDDGYVFASSGNGVVVREEVGEISSSITA